MTFSELVAEVIAITKRPDLQSSIESAVRAATLKAHQSDYFFNDLIEIAVEFDEPRYIQTFDPKQVIPRFRQAKYLRLWEGDFNGFAGEFLDHIHVENAIDGYGYIKTNVFYMAGAFLQIRGTCPVDKVLFGAYQHPLVIPEEQYASWIAAEYPWAIIYEAARVIFLQIGYQEQSASMRALVQEAYATLSVSNVDTVPT